MEIQSLAVFCGSRTGIDKSFAEDAIRLGELLAKHHIQLIYGGGKVGLMGVIADTVMQQGGKVIGVIPEILTKSERQHTGITELIKTPDMHSRKQIMYERCDAALVMPGGYGTMDEMFELITWNQLSIHDKKIYLLNTNGFYDPLIQQLQKMNDEKFLYRVSADMISVIQKPDDLFLKSPITASPLE